MKVTYQRLLRSENRGPGYVVLADGVGLLVTDDDATHAREAATAAARALDLIAGISCTVTELPEDLSGSNLR